MQKTFEATRIEEKWYQYWEERGYFEPTAEGTPYSIMIPPPNVTGSLHMGHAFQQTIMDALIRYQRMRGCSTLWQVGTDHAGIATQMVVERKLQAEQNKNRHDLGRDDFIKKIWDWKAESGGTITRQMRRLGNSVDWNRERFTMDPGLSEAVQEVFIRLHSEGLIYRGKRLVNWDPKLHTAISDLEVENLDRKGSLWHFRYPLADGAVTADGKDYLVVATTRPETMLGDTAVAVHPDDERYADLVGKFVDLPLVNRRIPVIADDYVDRDFGTGCVKITPAHDFNDYEVGKRHSLPMINLFDIDANILTRFDSLASDGSPIPLENLDAPEGYAGLDRFDARKQIIADFESSGLLDSIQDHSLKVPYGDRSGVPIEPLLTDQWYVSVEALAKPAIQAVENGDIQFVPKSYENMYFAWMRDLQDWCISRQLWWGHRIPAWYDNEGNTYVGRSEADVRQQHQLPDSLTLRQDEDVLDTWFSSALWTFSTLGWPQDTDDLRRFHPSDVLVTGFDIIFFWVARMIMMTLHFRTEVPFKKVYVTGLIRDDHGQKMSKSKGNVIDPLDMIDGISLEDLLEKRTGNMMQPQLAEKIAKRTRKEFPQGIEAHGTDALRFTLAALASTGRDINWDMHRLEGYRNFCNKIWNASRYVLMNTEGYDCGSDQNCGELSVPDRWIISRLQRLETDYSKALDNFRFDLAARHLYDFIWHEYCDWYLELSKPVLWDEQASSEVLRGTRYSLVRVLETLLRLAHPLMPFITEEIWQSVKELAGKRGDTLMLQPWPTSDSSGLDEEAERDVEWLKGIILAVRNIRGEMDISPARGLELLLRGGDQSDRERLQNTRALLRKLAGLESIRWMEPNEQAPFCATGLSGELEVLVPMAGIIDVDAELTRLERETERLVKEVSRFESKLGNANFVDRAPADVVRKEREKLEDARSALKRLQQQVKELNILKANQTNP